MDLTKVSQEDGLLRFQIAGRISQSDLTPLVDPFADLLGSAGYGQSVLLDLDNVEFIDSSGISWLLVRHKRFREAGGKLVIHSIPPMVRQVVKMLRLDQVFHIAKSESDAIATAAGGE